MKKIISFIINNKMICIAVALMVLMMLIPLPVIALDILIGIEVIFSLVVLEYSLTKHNKGMPKLVSIFIVLFLALNTSLARFSLTGYESGIKSRVVEFIANLVAGNNYICGAFIIAVLLVLQFFIISKGGCRIAEVCARFALDSMNHKFFEIDNKVNLGIIDKNEATALKNNVMMEVDFYSQMDGISRLLNIVFKVSRFFILVNLAGGMFIQILLLEKTVAMALENSMFITVGNAVLFIVPFMIVTVAAGLAMTGDKKNEKDI